MVIKRVLVMSLVILFSISFVAAAVINVPADQPTIQTAINAASSGDIINVSAGTYVEEIIINKSITLQGVDKNSVFVINNGSVDTVLIDSNNVSVKGLTINNTAGSYACIKINPNFDFINIEDNIINQGYYGVYARDHIENLIVYDSVFRDCYIGIYIREYDSDEIAPVVYNNEFYDDVYGMYVRYVRQGNSQVQIYNNYFEELTEDATAYGIYSYIASINATNNTFEKYGMMGMDFWTHGGAIAFIGSTSIAGWQNIKRSVVQDNFFNVWKGSAVEGYFADPLVIDNIINQLPGGYDVGIWIRGGTGWDPGSSTYGMWSIENVTFNGPGGGDGMFTTGGGYGLSAFSVNNSAFSNWGNAIRMITDGDRIDMALITQSNFTNNGMGILVTGSSRNITVNYNNIFGNTNGLQNTASENVSAEYNWWGDISGPSGDGNGTGDSITGNANYYPWLCEMWPTSLFTPCAPLADEDGDGVGDDDDLCPDSLPPPEPVDADGCDAFQFCGFYSCGVGCQLADFLGDEAEDPFPEDCTVVIIHDGPFLFPKCVPLSCPG